MHCLAHKICLSKDLEMLRKGVCALKTAILFYLSADSEFLELKRAAENYTVLQDHIISYICTLYLYY